MARNNLLRRLRYLRNWELFDSVLMPAGVAFLAWLNHVPTVLLYTYATGIIAFVLLQGSFYWHLKLRVVAGEAVGLPSYFSRAYTTLKRLNQALLAGYPLVCAVALLLGWSDGWEPFWATVLALFAVAEYVNYYHRQLMYDTRSDLRYLLRYGRLRPSHLAEDLAESNAE